MVNPCTRRVVQGQPPVGQGSYPNEGRRRGPRALEKNHQVAHLPQIPEAEDGSTTSRKAPTIRLASLPDQELAATLDEAIERYGSGVSVYVIAAEMGVEHTTLYRHLIKHREEQWRVAKVSRALAELEEAEDELKIAPDALALSRARERCRAAQWQLERLMRRIYGQDVPAATQAVQININLRRDAETLRHVPDISVTDHNP